MLLHDNLRVTDDAIKLFFMEVYELFIKVYKSLFMFMFYMQCSW